LGGPIVQAVSA